MERKVLTEKHPTRIKFEKLCQLAEELDLSLEFSCGYCVLTDHSEGTAGQYRIEDAESDMDPMLCFPPYTEYKICIG